MLTRVLGDAGYRTLEARQGEEALRMVTFAYPYLHLVITDVLMPEVDGRGAGAPVARTLARASGAPHFRISRR